MRRVRVYTETTSGPIKIKVYRLDTRRSRTIAATGSVPQELARFNVHYGIFKTMLSAHHVPS
jgi:hypothetical protein